MLHFQFIETNGTQLRVAMDGPETGQLVLLAHGFPESWFSWRHQIGALAGAGYRVAAPDMRGYGGSDQPAEVEAYRMEAMTGDMAGLVDVLSPDRPGVIIGHDWGAPIAWNSALLFPDHFSAVAGLSIPHVPMGPFTILDLTQKAFIENDRFFYMHYFQQSGRAEADFAADVPGAIRKMYYGWSGDAPADFFPEKSANARLLDGITDVPEQMPDWFPPEVEAYYVGEFERTGWAGALNRYRNFPRDQAFLCALDSQIIGQPSLFIIGGKDPVQAMFPGDLETLLSASLSDLRGVHILEGCGHWTQQERPEETNDLLLNWLQEL